MPQMQELPRSPQAKLRHILTNPDTYATSLLLIFVDRYGAEALQWAPETIKLQIEEDFGVELPKVCFDRLMAAILVLTTNYFYKQLPVFIQVCNALSGDDFDPQTFDPADSVECAWGITEAALIEPPDFAADPDPFADDIRHYIAAVLRDEGYVSPPDVLRIAVGADLGSQIQTDWGDDPDMFQAIYQVQQAKTADTEATIRDNLNDLVREIESLPLTNGQTTAMASRMRSNLQAAQTA